MAARIEDYAIIGDTQTAALVARDGAIDWTCFPRFDSDACFAALLGDRSNGRWLLGCRDVPSRIRRRYRPDTMVLETEMEVESGVVRLIDFMPIRDERPDIVRIVEGVRGTVPMQVDFVVRFGNGRVTALGAQARRCAHADGGARRALPAGRHRRARRGSSRRSGRSTSTPASGGRWR